MINLNEYAVKIYEQNKAVGWWDDPNRCIYETLQLVSTEIAEATEGERKNLMDDHLPHRKMGEVELADALIRLLDMGGRYGWDYMRGTGHAISWLTGGASIGKQHLCCNIAIVELGVSMLDNYSFYEVSSAYARAIDTVIGVSQLNGYDIWGAMDEKLEYNKSRADHKRENRALENGKKF